MSYYLPVCEPHVPMHGSTHFWFKQASCKPHSADTTHSGLQFGGEPIIFVWQAHTAAPFVTRQFEFGPPDIMINNKNAIMFQQIENLYKIFKTYMDLDCIDLVGLELVLVDMQQMDHQYSLVSMYSLGCDLKQHKLPVIHKYLHMDRHICYWGMLLMDCIRCSWCIGVGSRYTDLQSNLWCMYKWHCHTLRCYRCWD